eukprot:GHVN01066971.1.p1 GENE.GHVN01066971.1~~GHVN01066971.1.p1  ORF type:complete len:196 (+),score=22.84 GHVN01066971.1:47-589(+)
MDEKDGLLLALMEIKELRAKLDAGTFVPSRVDTNPHAECYQSCGLVSARVWHEAAAIDSVGAEFEKQASTEPTGSMQSPQQQRMSLAVAKALLTLKNLGETYESLCFSTPTDPEKSQGESRAQKLFVVGQKLQMLKISYLLLRKTIQDAVTAVLTTRKHRLFSLEQRGDKLKQFLDPHAT